MNTTFTWVTTSPNPLNPATGYDAGQRGWRLHAIELKDGEPYEEYKRRTALCGLWPRHGWGVDLFIDAECSRCVKAMEKREAAGEVFIDMADIWRERREKRERDSDIIMPVLWALIGWDIYE